MSTKRTDKEMIANLEGDLMVAEKGIKELTIILNLVVKDLKMRANEDRVINISNFIWERLSENKYLNKEA